MAVDVDSFTDNNIINGTLSHTVTVTPATEIDSVSYRVENSTLSNEVSVDDVDYTVDDTETGINVTLKPHILRHEQASTGSADIVITITDIYGRSVNVTNHITIMKITNRFPVGLPYLSNLNVASTADDFNPSDYYLTINDRITPEGLVNGNTVNILNSFRGPVVDADNKLTRTEFINNGEFVVTTSQPTQTVPTMTNGPLFVRVANNRKYINVPIALLSDFLPSTWDDASIFDNLINDSTFKYKPNNSHLKLYTYNDGWDDRDYIIFNVENPAIPRNITPTVTSYSNNYRPVAASSAGCITDIIDESMFTSSNYQNFRNGLAIPRFTTNYITRAEEPNGQNRPLNESDYGITYSSSNSSSSDKAVTPHIYMYANNASIWTNAITLTKNRGWTFILNNAYQNNRPATQPEVALKDQGNTIISPES